MASPMLADRIRIIIRVRNSRFGGAHAETPQPRHRAAKTARPGAFHPARRRHSARPRFAFSSARARSASPRSASPRRPASASARSISTSRTSRRSCSASSSTSGRRPARRSTRSSATRRARPRSACATTIRAFFHSECDEAPLRLALDAAAPVYHDAPGVARATAAQSAASSRAFLAAAAPRASARQRRVRRRAHLHDDDGDRQAGLRATPDRGARSTRWADAVADMLGAYLGALGENQLPTTNTAE